MMQGIKNTTQEQFVRLMSNGFHYEVPKYQRDYSWDKEQWSDLWYDLMQMIEEKDSHYMGYLVLQTSDDINFKIIDGQQRITTICILILAVINYLKKIQCSEDEKKLNEQRANTLLTTYIGNIDMITLTSVNKLVLNRNNNHFYKTYLSSLQEAPKRGLNASERLMKNAFDTFSSYLKEQYKNAEELIFFVENIVNNLFFTVITVTDELNAFKVFETLNARGVQLSSSDLLKNYLFSVANEQHQTKLDELEDLWADVSDILKETQVSDFLRIYWNSNHKTIRKNQLYKTIRDEIKTSEQSFSLLRDMRKKADIYMALKSSEDELWRNNKDIRENLELLRLFNVTQHMSLLISAYSNLSLKEFDSLLSKIVIISFRYNIICGKNPNEQEVLYNKLALDIELNKTYNINDLLNSGIYVKDAEFEQTFTYKEFVDNSRNNQIAKYILCKLEKFEYGLTVDRDDTTLEHILPDNPDESWEWDDSAIQQYKYRLGNMALLEKGKNSDLGNASYLEKKDVYSKSSIPSTKKIGDTVTEWSESIITTRQQKMAKIAKGIWQI